MIGAATIATSSAASYITITHGGGAATSSTISNPYFYQAANSLMVATTGSMAITPALPISRSAKGGYLLPDGTPLLLSLPDGSVLDVKADGSFEVSDAAAKVTYRANRVRNFNSFINASDKIEDFIRFCGDAGVRQGEMLHLPLHLFIKWLVTEAAKADQEPAQDVGLLPDLRKHVAPKCVCCGRFLPRRLTRSQIQFCGPRCFDQHFVTTHPPHLLERAS